MKMSIFTKYRYKKGEKNKLKKKRSTVHWNPQILIKIRKKSLNCIQSMPEILNLKYSSVHQMRAGFKAAVFSTLIQTT